MKSPFNADQLRASLQPFEDTEGMVFDEQVTAYVEFYGIDFSNQFEGLQHRIGYFDTPGYRLVLQGFTPVNPKGTIFVFHGYFDHVGIFNHVLKYAIEQGYAVLMFDLPGHGLSSGPIAAIQDFREYQEVLTVCIDLVKNKFPEPWNVIAQSTGAAIVIDFLLGGGYNEATSPFKKVVFLAPLVRPVDWKITRGLYHVVSPFTHYIKRKFAINSNDSEFLTFLKEQDPLQSKKVSSKFIGAMIEYISRVENADPIAFSPLVLQGDSDGTVDRLHNMPILERKFLEPKIIILENVMHQVANESPELRKIIFDHITPFFNR